jgi:two-component system, cell cycle response regulator DivK
MDAGPARILVIEDDHDLMRLICHTLTAAGFAVVEAEGGEAGLHKARQEKPDLILTDLAMPKMSGVEVIHQLKNDPDTQDIPCVAVTAFSWDNIAQSASQVGCDSFVAKPFNADRLLKEVAKYVPMPDQAPPRSGSPNRV